MRNALGQFDAGHTGNAGGRPKDEHKVAELARSYIRLPNYDQCAMDNLKYYRQILSDKP